MLNRKWLFLFFILSIFSSSAIADEWYKAYMEGLELLQVGNYSTAENKFQEALSTKNQDAKRIRTYGMHFIEYYPNRELGVCQYFLGNYQLAKEYLEISMKQEPTDRASHFLDDTKKKIEAIEIAERLSKAEELRKAMMSIAVLPFKNLYEHRLVEIVLSNFIASLTAHVNTENFKVLQQSELDWILEKQKLRKIELLNASNAAKLGEHIGVDMIIEIQVSVDGNLAILNASAFDIKSTKIFSTGYHTSNNLENISDAEKTLFDEFFNKFKDEYKERFSK
jgi:hypothetical protein